jgi:molybdopterin synthase catalytic subunit/molybdopterin converting factor small subunit
VEVKIRLFAGLRQAAGYKEKTIELTEDATVADLLAHLPDAVTGRTFYVSVNQEYAQRDTLLHDGDEVGLLPPVSGGSMTKLYEITSHPLSQDDILRRVSRPDCGAVVTFAGTVRGSTAVDAGERGTDFLEYEAYTEMAERTMAQIGDEIMQKWPQVKAVSILHRIGRCEIEEPTVLIAVATPHRGDGCFEACRYAIERLKAIVPIWKEENWSDGSVWVEGPRQPELDLGRPEGE